MSTQQGNRGLPFVTGRNSQSVDKKTESKQDQNKNSNLKQAMKKNKKHMSTGSLQLENNKKRLFEIDFGKLDDVLVPGFDYSKYDRKSSPKKKSQRTLSKNSTLDSLKRTRRI